MEMAQLILNYTHRHSYFVQAISNCIYSLRKMPLTIKDFELMSGDYLLEKKVFYEEFPGGFSRQPFRTCKAIAQEGKVASNILRKSLDAAFVKSAGSMHRIIKALEEKQSVLKKANTIGCATSFLDTI